MFFSNLISARSMNIQSPQACCRFDSFFVMSWTIKCWLNYCSWCQNNELLSVVDAQVNLIGFTIKRHVSIIWECCVWIFLCNILCASLVLVGVQLPWPDLASTLFNSGQVEIVYISPQRPLVSFKFRFRFNYFHRHQSCPWNHFHFSFISIDPPCLRPTPTQGD